MLRPSRSCCNCSRACARELRLDERRKRGTNQLVPAERLDSKLGNPLNGALRADVRIAAGGVLRVVEVTEVGDVPLE